MRVAIAGARGFIGSALTGALTAAGHETIAFVRHPPVNDGIEWNPAAGTMDSAKIEGVDAVINLAGENIAGRWDSKKKKRIRESRILGTHLLAETIASLDRKPAVFLCASAVGIYGNHGDEILTEESPPGTGFLPETGVEWEAQSEVAKAAGIRVSLMRFGIVLDKSGGALKKMLLPFKYGVGGVLGSGRQYMSWISREDMVRAIVYILETDTVSGPINVVAPNPVTNREFTRALAAELRRPALIPVPAFALRALFGEMADEALLSGARVIPKKLQQSGFRFNHATVQEALRHALR